MFQIEIAGLVVRIENRFDYVRNLCREYIISGTTADLSNGTHNFTGSDRGPDRCPDITVSVSEEELRWEIEKASDNYFMGDGYGEGVVTYEKISNALPAYNAFVMHSSVVAVDGQAYCFAAESGKGKSTHTRYWKEVLGERVTVINGDKPIYRFKGTELMAYGTPWCGKEGWQTNTSASLKALCLLEQAEENAIYPVNAFDMLNEMLRHFYLPGGDQVDMPKMMELIDRMIETVPVYRLCCRNDRSAAEIAIEHFGL